MDSGHSLAQGTKSNTQSIAGRCPLVWLVNSKGCLRCPPSEWKPEEPGFFLCCGTPSHASHPRDGSTSSLLDVLAEGQHVSENRSISPSCDCNPSCSSSSCGQHFPAHSWRDACDRLGSRNCSLLHLQHEGPYILRIGSLH